MAEYAGHRTEHAAKGHALALVFTSVLGKRIEGYDVELAAPEESTGGGIRTLQRIRLLPRAEGASAIVVGEADADKGRAELRTLGHVQEIHRRRFGKDAPLKNEEYLAFLEGAKKVLQDFGLQVTMNAIAEAPPSAARTSRASIHAIEESPRVPAWLVAAIAAFVIGLGVGYLILRQR